MRRSSWTPGAESPADVALLERWHFTDPLVQRLFGTRGFFNFYGTFADRIRRANVDGRWIYEPFPYDWRLDIRASALALKRKLETWPPEWTGSASHTKKAYIIIAHSMGGLVAMTWHNAHYEPSPESSRRVRALVLLGSPLLGSCEMLRMLQQGYQVPGARSEAVGPSRLSKIENRLFRHLGKDLRAMAFTFPGAFQLLPPVPARLDAGACLYSGARPERRDYFDPAVWESETGLDILRGVPEALEVSPGDARAFVRQQLAPILALAREFRETFSLSLPRCPLFLFYSDAWSTPFRGVVSDRTEHLASWKEDVGDGRVTPDSACGGDSFPETIQPERLLNVHGDLPADRTFLDDFVDRRLPRMAAAHIAVEAARLMLHPDREGLFRAYLEGGGGKLSWRETQAGLEGESRPDPTIVPGGESAKPGNCRGGKDHH